MLDGIIELDSQCGVELGFTSDLFDGYLWKDRDRVLISFIESKTPGQGNISALFSRIEAAGFRVAVPTPLGRMISILEKKGFVSHLEWTGDVDFNLAVDIWEKPVNVLQDAA